MSQPKTSLWAAFLQLLGDTLRCFSAKGVTEALRKIEETRESEKAREIEEARENAYMRTYANLFTRDFSQEALHELEMEIAYLYDSDYADMSEICQADLEGTEAAYEVGMERSLSVRQRQVQLQQTVTPPETQNRRLRIRPRNAP